MDTSEVCNEVCVWCWSHSGGASGTAKVSLEAVEHVMSQTVGWKLKSINPYNSGDTMLETRMPEIVKIIRKYNDSPIVLFTNGTIYANRELLNVSGVTEVHFTISATTRETYALMHGKDLYNEAVKTIEWLETQQNHPKIVTTFIMTNRNIHELPLWREQWKRFEQSISPVVNKPELKLPIEVELANCTKAFDPKLIDLPCVFWDVLLIQLNGDVQMCCGGGPGVFGNVHGDTPLLKAWHSRCTYGSRLLATHCRSCQFRSEDWIKRLVN